MILSLAPMEGLTGATFRQVHARHFGRMDRYYTPFVAPPRVGSRFGSRARGELNQASDQGLNVIPQLLTKNADEFVWASELLAQMGYHEVNLNLGCPSGTVAAKGKGSGFLAHLEELDAFLAAVCERSALPVSVKTRLGVESDAEYEQILAMYCNHPLAELIVHPRIQKDFYNGRPRWEPYGETLGRAPFGVAYNGDIFAPDDVEALLAAYPATRHVMLGRGVVANPALALVLRGGAPATRDELRCFCDELFCAYEDEMGNNAVHRMKEWWFYAKSLFADPMAVRRAVRKTRGAEEYRAAVERVFATQPLADSPRFCG